MTSVSERLRLGFMVLAVLVGLATVVLVIAVGHCSAFGGRCPAEAPPLFDDEVFWMSVAGAALAFGVPGLLSRRFEHRRWMGLVLAAGVATVVGFVARSAVLG